MSQAPHPISPGYETRDAHFGPLVKFIAWTGISLVVVLVSMWALLELCKKLKPPGDEREPHPLAALDSRIPVGPSLEMLRGVKHDDFGNLIEEKNPQPFTMHRWIDLKTEAVKQTTTYGWVDRQAGIVRVPIERAMQLALEKGFPTAPPKPKN